MIAHMFQEIESGRTANVANVASGLRSFLTILGDFEPVKTLAAAARSDEKVASAVLARTITLSQLQIDTRYENPNDVALAAYLQILSLTAWPIFAAACDAVEKATNCWWALRTLSAARSQTASSEHTTADESAVGMTGHEEHFVLTPPVEPAVTRITFHALNSDEMRMPLRIVTLNFDDALTLPASIGYAATFSPTGILETAAASEGILTYSRVNTPTANQLMPAA